MLATWFVFSEPANEDCGHEQANTETWSVELKMVNELNLKLPERTVPKSSGQKFIALLLVLVLGIGAVNLIISWRAARGPREATTDLTPEALKELALKFEKQDLIESAIGTWKDYLAVVRINPEDRAKIWYRLGKLYQQGGNYERALDAFYRSETLARINELEPEISRRVQECLEAMGKFTALQNDLTGRVGVDKSQQASQDEVVAQIGPWKMTRAELDKEIEAQIDSQLSQFASYFSPEELNKQKEDLLKRLASSSERLKLLNQYIAEELLYRRARENKLADDPATRAFLKAAERKILAKKVLDKELADQIKITPGDLETYYEANKKKYLKDGKQKTFEDVRAEVYQALRTLKEGEVEQRLFGELKNRYNVVIYSNKFIASTTQKNDKTK
jgi:hypothetical protein